MRASGPQALPSFRGEVHEGPEAARRGSLVSGPFEASPEFYVIPRDAEDVAALVRWAVDEEKPLIPRGAGTGMPGGNLGPGVVVDLAALSGIGPVDRDRRTLRVGAGAVAARAQEAAAGAGLRLSALPASSRWCSIGGIAANNGAGAASFGHGSFHRRVRAVEGVDARGEPFRVTSEGADSDAVRAAFRSLEGLVRTGDDGTIPGWPRVRKNASGYALDRFLPAGDPVQLLVGSEGTLAFFTALELELDPVPHERGLVLTAAESPEHLVELCAEARRSPAVACEFLGSRLLRMTDLGRDSEIGPLAAGAFALVLLEVEGTADEVERGLDHLRRIAREGRGLVATRDVGAIERMWGLRHRASPLIAAEAERGRVSTQFIEDSVVPPEQLGHYLVGVESILASQGLEAVTFGHAGDGNAHVNPLVDVTSSDWKDRVRTTLDEVATLVRGLGGTLSGEHGDGRLRAPFLGRIWPEPLVDAFRRVKETFDPAGILNPGVILPLPDQDPLEALRPRPRTFP